MEEMKKNEVQVEGLTEKEAKEFKTLLSKFVKSYSAKDSAVSDKEWLKNELKSELSDLSDEQAEVMAQETIDSIKEYDENLKDLNEQCKKGVNREQWFADKVAKASAGLGVIEHGNYLNSIDTALTNANSQMIRTVTTSAGDISQCINLDGYIAEQFHVNRFNVEAALHKSNFYAEVQVPAPGETYGKNSFDIVIKDRLSGSNVPVHQYQVKFGANAKETIKLLKDAEGNCRYNNQRIVVPTEQLEEVQRAFPEKTITDKIGGTDKVKISSEGLTKSEAKEMQFDAQENQTILGESWNSFSTKELALNIGKQAGLVGLGAAAITVGFSLAEQAIKGDGIDAEETVKLALETGADASIKVAAAGALKVAVEKGILRIIPKGTPIGIIANIACVAIENVKILFKMATGEYTVSQGMEHMGRTSVSMIYGLGWGAIGMHAGGVAFAWIPIVGPIVGGLVGGLVGYTAGSKFGNAVFDGVKKVVTSAGNALRTIGNKISEGFQRIREKIHPKKVQA